MLIYTPAVTNRCRYACKLIFSDILNIPCELTDDVDVYNACEKEKIAYTATKPGNGFFIEPATLLFENDLHKVETAIFPFEGTKAFFRTSSGNFPFDIFAASFYLVSRYEEYLPSPADEYGRFQAINSVAGRFGFLETPVVNRWARELAKALAVYYPSFSCNPSSFSCITSFDIDVAFAFTGRPFLRNVKAILKDIVMLRLTNLVWRICVISGKKQDPYDSYAEIQKTLALHTTEIIFFFLLGRTPSRFDRNLPPSSARYRDLIRRISRKYQTGIHPSYYSSNKPSLMPWEKEMLEEITQQPVTKSRQHYLRFTLPDTYLQLINAGITDDYSMGYASAPGFRAGICTPFYFYNLREEVATTLKIHPVTYMDGTFIEDLQMSPAESLETIIRLISAVKEVQGVFMCIWHNHTVSDTGMYTGWKRVFTETLKVVTDNKLTV